MWCLDEGFHDDGAYGGDFHRRNISCYFGALYQDHVNAAQVRALYAEVTGYRALVEERVAAGKRVVNNDELGFTQSRLAAPEASFETYNSDGTVSLSLLIGGAANPFLAGVSISTIRSVSGVWRCSINGSLAVGWKDSYRPVDC